MKIRVLLIGLGRIGSLLEKDPLRYHPCTHAGVIFSNFGKKHFLLTGILDSDPSRVSRFIRDWKIKPETVKTSAAEIRRGEYDLAVIASNSPNHYENTLFAVNCGIKNLLIEKPVAISLTQARKILNLKKKHGLRIWVNHERRYHPLYRYVREMVMNETWGKLKTIRAAVLTSAMIPGKAKESISPLLHDGTHAVDFIHWLLGNPESVHSRSYKSTPELPVYDQNIAWLGYKNGVNVFLESGGMRNYFQFEIDIQTTGGRFVLSNDGSRFYTAGASGLYKNFNSLKDVPVPRRLFRENPFILLYTEIVENLQYGRGGITGGIEANIEIMKLIGHIEKKGKSLK